MKGKTYRFINIIYKENIKMKGKKLQFGVPNHIIVLVQEMMQTYKMKEPVIIRKIIHTGIRDFFSNDGETREFDFSKSNSEMLGQKASRRLSTTLSQEDIEKLTTIQKECGVETMSLLLRRITTIIALDWMLDINGLPVLRMVDE